MSTVCIKSTSVLSKTINNWQPPHVTAYIHTFYKLKTYISCNTFKSHRRLQDVVVSVSVKTLPPIKELQSVLPSSYQPPPDPIQEQLNRITSNFSLVLFNKTSISDYVPPDTSLKPPQWNARWDSSVGIATRYRHYGPGMESRWWRHFPHTFRPALGAHSASYTMHTGCLSQGWSCLDVALTTHHHLPPRLKKSKKNIPPPRGLYGLL